MNKPRDPKHSPRVPADDAQRLRRCAPVFALVGLFAVLGSSAHAARVIPEPPLIAPNPDPFWPADHIFPGKGVVWASNRFHNVNYERRLLFSQNREKDQGGVVFLGDSITQGWKDLETAFPEIPLKIVNRGINGDTTPNVLFRVEEDVVSLNPRAVVLLIGTNDLRHGVSPAEITENIQAIIQKLRSRDSRLPIVLCLVMPRGGDAEFPDRIPRLNARLQGLANAAMPKIKICDTYGPFVQPDLTSNPSDFTDRLHPNASGYAKWRAALLPLLQTIAAQSQ